jgi:hypothetical protein
MEGLCSPITRDLQVLLRRAVLDHALAEPRRVFPPMLHVGVPTECEAVFADVEPTDHGLRCDIVAAMLRRASGGPTTPLVWLTRPGALELQDVDMWWLAAARAAYAEAGVPLVMVTVNRRGWRDPRSGLGRSWARMRPRRSSVRFAHSQV